MKLFGIDISKVPEQVGRHGYSIGFIIAGAVAGTFILNKFHADAPNDFVVQAMQMQIKSTRREIEALKDQPLYPPIWDTWQETGRAFDTCGVKFSMSGNKGKKVGYSGPVTSWQASIEGPSDTVLSCLLNFPETPLVHIAQISIQSDKASALIDVLGRKVNGVHNP